MHFLRQHEYCSPPDCLSQCESELFALCLGTKGIGYALLILLVLLLGITLSKGKGKRVWKVKYHCIVKWQICMFVHVFERKKLRFKKGYSCRHKQNQHQQKIVTGSNTKGCVRCFFIPFGCSSPGIWVN